jgi:tripartite-type tricarboxylate transporter receptor subunit TctC
MRALSSAALALALAAPAAAQTEDFYKGKTVTILVGFSPGGGFDVNARLLARHLGKYIPGKPEVVVSNMNGAASLTAVQYLDTRAPKDGTVIDTFNFGLIGDSILFPERVKADFRGYGWVGSISTDISVCYTWGALGLKTLEDVKKRPELHMGDVGPGTSAYVNQNILKRIFGVNIKQVLGYPGSAEQRIAIERGELDGDCGAWSSLSPDWVDGNKVNPLMRSNPGFAPGMPENVPYMADIAPDAHAKALIRLLTSSGGVGRPYIVSRDVPAERLKILREAFDATMRDPEFLGEAAKLRLPVTPRNGEDSRKLVEEIYGAPPELVKEGREIAGG